MAHGKAQKKHTQTNAQHTYFPLFFFFFTHTNLWFYFQTHTLTHTCFLLTAFLFRNPPQHKRENTCEGGKGSSPDQVQGAGSSGGALCLRRFSSAVGAGFNGRGRR